MLVGKAIMYGESDWERFLNQLGLTSRPVAELFAGDSANVRFLRNGKPHRDYVPKLEVHKVRPAFRTGREGRQVEQVLITLTQRVSADIGVDAAPQPMVFRGGCSLILSLGNLNAVEYVIRKNIRSYTRFLRQAAYLRGETDTALTQARSTYVDDDSRLAARLQPCSTTSSPSPHPGARHEPAHVRPDPDVPADRTG